MALPGLHQAIENFKQIPEHEQWKWTTMNDVTLEAHLSFLEWIEKQIRLVETETMDVLNAPASSSSIARQDSVRTTESKGEHPPTPKITKSQDGKTRSRPSSPLGPKVSTKIAKSSKTSSVKKETALRRTRRAAKQVPADATHEDMDNDRGTVAQKHDIPRVAAAIATRASKRLLKMKEAETRSLPTVSESCPTKAIKNATIGHAQYPRGKIGATQKPTISPASTTNMSNQDRVPSKTLSKRKSDGDEIANINISKRAKTTHNPAELEVIFQQEPILPKASAKRKRADTETTSTQPSKRAKITDASADMEIKSLEELAPSKASSKRKRGNLEESIATPPKRSKLQEVTSNEEAEPERQPPNTIVALVAEAT